MSRITHLSNGKSVMILGTVVGCLIILWPNIFYPMIQGGFQATSQDIDVKSKIHPRMMSSKSPPKSFNGQSNFYGPNSHIPSIDQNTIGGASVGLIMTIYTVGIIFLFFYTIFKYVSSNDSLDYLDNDQAYCDTGYEENARKGEPTFDKIDHKQGECLKKLAINYVRCKSKISNDHPEIVNDEDGVSMAYRTLLSDMLELRDYLSELQCSINGCQPCDDEFCNCSDEIIYDQEDIFEPEHDFGFDIDIDTIDQMFDSDNIQNENDTKKLEEEKVSNQSENEEESEKDSVEIINDLMVSKMTNNIKRLNKSKVTKEE